MFLPRVALLVAVSLAPPASATPPPPAASDSAPVATATTVAAPAAVLPAVMAWAPAPATDTRAERANLFTLVVNGGRHVVTAGHGVGELDEAGATLSVILTDGRQVPARLARRSALDSQDEDWAVLELTNVPSGAVSVAVGAARPGGLAFIMGYPERVGLGADGHATSALSAEPLALDPPLFVARVPTSAGTELEPLAGALPLSGASGSPVFDENGALVGVLVAIGRLAYPDGLRHVYRVSMSADFRAALGT